MKKSEGLREFGEFALTEEQKLACYRESIRKTSAVPSGVYEIFGSRELRKERKGLMRILTQVTRR